MVKATIKIGLMELTCEAANMKEIFKWSATYGNLPKTCDECNSSDLFLNHRTSDSNDFYGLKCVCGAEGKFGQHKTGGTLFYKWDTKMVKYIPGPPSNNNKQSSQRVEPEDNF